MAITDSIIINVSTPGAEKLTAVDKALQGLNRTIEQNRESSLRAAKARLEVAAGLDKIRKLTDLDSAATRINARVHAEAAEKMRRATLSNLRTIESSSSRIASSLRGVAFASGAALTAMTAFGTGAAKAIFNTRSEFEKMEQQLLVLTGDKGAFAKIRDFALKSPLTFRESVDATNQLMNIGVKFGDILRADAGYLETMTKMAVFAHRPLEQVVRALSMLREGNYQRRYLTPIDITRQSFIDAGIPWDDKKNRPMGLDPNTGPSILDKMLRAWATKRKDFDPTEQLGTKISNIGDAMDLLYNELGKRLETFAKPFLTRLQTFIADIVKTVAGPEMTRAFNALAQNFLGPIGDNIMGGLEKMSAFLKEHPEALTNAVIAFTEAVKALFAVFVAATAGSVVANLVSGLSSLLILLGTPGGAVGLIAMVAALAGAFLLVKTRLDDFTKSTQGALDGLDKIDKKLRDETIVAMNDAEVATGLLNQELAKQGEDTFWGPIFRNLDAYIQRLTALDQLNSSKAKVSELGEQMFKGQAKTEWDLYSFMGGGPTVTYSGGSELMVRGKNGQPFRLTYQSWQNGQAAAFMRENGGMFYNGQEIRNLGDIYSILGGGAVDKAKRADDRGKYGPSGMLSGSSWKEGDPLPNIGDVIDSLPDAEAEKIVQELWKLPVSGKVTSPFGMRHHPIHGTDKMHNGVDLGAAAGTPIEAALSGKVTKVWYDSTNGNAIVIEHSPGVTSHYAHMLEKSGLGVGDMVKQGDVIGAVGSTGSSTGNHLHWAVKINGKWVNPEKLIGTLAAVTGSIPASALRSTLPLSDSFGLDGPAEMGYEPGKPQSIAEYLARQQAQNAGFNVFGTLTSNNIAQSRAQQAERLQGAFNMSQAQLGWQSQMATSSGDEKWGAFLGAQQQANELTQALAEGKPADELMEMATAFANAADQFKETAPAIQTAMMDWVTRFFEYLNALVAARAVPSGQRSPAMNLLLQGNGQFESFGTGLDTAGGGGHWEPKYKPGSCENGQCEPTGEYEWVADGGSSGFHGGFSKQEAPKKTPGAGAAKQLDLGATLIANAIQVLTASITGGAEGVRNALVGIASQLVGTLIPGPVGQALGGLVGALFGGGNKKPPVVQKIIDPVAVFPDRNSLAFSSNPASALFGNRPVATGAGFTVTVEMKDGLNDMVAVKIANAMFRQNGLDGMLGSLT